MNIDIQLTVQPLRLKTKGKGKGIVVMNIHDEMSFDASLLEIWYHPATHPDDMSWYVDFCFLRGTYDWIRIKARKWRRGK